jgi:hypothetical protein
VHLVFHGGRAPARTARPKRTPPPCEERRRHAALLAQHRREALLHQEMVRARMQRRRVIADRTSRRAREDARSDYQDVTLQIFSYPQQTSTFCPCQKLDNGSEGTPARHAYLVPVCMGGNLARPVEAVRWHGVPIYAHVHVHDKRRCPCGLHLVLALHVAAASYGSPLHPAHRCRVLHLLFPPCMSLPPAHPCCHLPLRRTHSRHLLLHRMPCRPLPLRCMPLFHLLHPSSPSPASSHVSPQSPCSAARLPTPSISLSSPKNETTRSSHRRKRKVKNQGGDQREIESGVGEGRVSGCQEMSPPSGVKKRQK